MSKLLTTITLLLLSMLSYAEPHEVIIMTFNVENLFDYIHDEGKNDETYLPIEEKQTTAHVEKCNRITVLYWREQCLYWDWNKSIVEQKLKTIGIAITQVNSGKGPDIIAFQEVENRNILARLRDEYLSDMGYQSLVLLEGKDIRGIDVAFLSKFPVFGAKLHEIEFPESEREQVGDTRPILEVSFELDGGEQITGFAVHFPAPFHPTSMRESAYSSLNELLGKLPRDRIAFAAGDFNTTSEENKKNKILDNWARPFWQIAHELCRRCLGSSYYAPSKEWSFLDMILWRPAGAWKMTGSYLANQTPAQVTEQGTPKRFSLPEATGLSDHWPLVMVIEK